MWLLALGLECAEHAEKSIYTQGTQKEQGFAERFGILVIYMIL